MYNEGFFVRWIMFTLLACFGSGLWAVASDDDLEIYDGIEALFFPHDFELQAFRQGLIDRYYGDDYADDDNTACPPDECLLNMSISHYEGQAGYKVSCTQCGGIMECGFYKDLNANTVRGAELLCTLTKLHLRIIDQRPKNSH